MKTVCYLIFFLNSFFGFAESISWTGNVSNDWNNPNNWSLNRIPIDSDSIIIRNSDTISVIGKLSLSHLELHNSHLQCSDSLIILNSLKLEFSSISGSLIKSYKAIKLRIKDSKCYSKLKLICDSIYLFRNEFYSPVSFEYSGNHYDAIKGANHFKITLHGFKIVIVFLGSIATMVPVTKERLILNKFLKEILKSLIMTPRIFLTL